MEKRDSCPARVGDWLVEHGAAGRVRREGEIVEVRHADGSPPYLVRWLDTGQTTLVFPGPDAHVVGQGAYTAAARS